MAIAIGSCVVWARFQISQREASRAVLEITYGGKNPPGIRVFPCDSHEKAVELAKVLA